MAVSANITVITKVMIICGEDMAVPKSISKFMEKGLKKSATRETCYTWFPCTEEFLENEEKQKQYLNTYPGIFIWKLK